MSVSPNSTDGGSSACPISLNACVFIVCALVMPVPPSRPPHPDVQCGPGTEALRSECPLSPPSFAAGARFAGRRLPRVWHCCQTRTTTGAIHSTCSLLTQPQSAAPLAILQLDLGLRVVHPAY